MARKEGKRPKGMKVNADLNLLPLMNIIIVLIPMLLLSAVFIEIKTIDMAPPPVAAASNQPIPEQLDLAIRVADDAYVIEGRGVPPTMIPRPAQRELAPGNVAASALTKALAVVESAHPENQDIRIVAQANTRYEELVGLMDAARAAGLPLATLEGYGSES